MRVHPFPVDCSLHPLDEGSFYVHMLVRHRVRYRVRHRENGCYCTGGVGGRISRLHPVTWVEATVRVRVMAKATLWQGEIE